MDSILISTKRLSGVMPEHEHFDPEQIMYINSVMFILKQMGVGPAEGFVVVDEDDTWQDFIPDDKCLREATKTYMGAKVKLQFDPPSSSAHLEALNNIIKEFEWRLNSEVDFPSSQG